jgi:hypothetical protein
MVIFFLYSQSTSPSSGEVFLSPSLYNFAIVVLISFFACTILMVFGLLSAFFMNRAYETRKSKLVYYLQIPFRERKIQYVFILSSIIYFIFFGFAANLFILFNNDGTVSSLFPLSLNSNSHSSKHDHSSKVSHNPESANSINALQSKDLDLQATHSDHRVNVSTSEYQESDSLPESQISNPSYRLIICCNNFGYVPMLTLYINSSFSFLLIPLNLFIGIVTSILVGLNISFNVFVIKSLKINYRNLSKQNFLSGLGFSSGFLVGCPTCAGSLLYTLVGFSSLVTFSSLSFYQIFFIIIGIPALILSLVVMAKLSRKNLCDIPGLH